MDEDEESDQLTFEKQADWRYVYDVYNKQIQWSRSKGAFFSSIEASSD